MRAVRRQATWSVSVSVLLSIAGIGAAAAQFTFTEAGGSIIGGQSVRDSASTTLDASGQSVPMDGAQIVTMRVAWNVNADAGPGLVAPETGILSFTVGFILEHPASFNLRLDFSLEGGLLRLADNPDCVAAVSQAAIAIPTLRRLGAPDEEFPIGIVLAGEALELAGNSAGVGISRQASTRLLFRDQPVDASAYAMTFLVSATAISQSCEVSARFGAQNGSTTSCDACGYPGALERLQARDGLFITAIFENLCGNGTLDPGEACDLGEINGAEGTCCDRFCRAAQTGSACGDDGNLCTADTCAADGRCIHPPVDGARCTAASCICDHDGQFCNGEVECAAGGSLCVQLPPPCAEDDVCDEVNDTCLTPFGTATPALATPSPTPTATTGVPTATGPPDRSPTVIAARCTGDCNDDRTVVVNELVLGVNLALARQPLSACPAFDANGDGRAAVNELVAAVRNTLAGCPP